MAYKSSADYARAIVGDRKAGRPENDFYPTPAYITEALFEREKFSSTCINEPACGDGAISKVAERFGYDVFSSDLVYRGYGVPDSIDFLDTQYIKGDIVTNPPFSLATKFIYHAMIDLKVNKMALFLKLAGLETVERKPLMEKYLQTVYVFSKRPKLSRDGSDIKGAGMLAFAWFVFVQYKTGESIVRWI